MQYGAKKAGEVIKRITKSVNDLLVNEKKGPSVEAMFGVETDYRYLVVAPNYIFYKIEDTCIKVINIYHEKEDFTWQLFGIDTTSFKYIESKLYL